MKINIRGIILVTCLLAFTGCEKDDKEIKYEGEAVFTSRRTISGDTYLSYGFSFEKGDNIPFTLSGGSVPDILVTNITDVSNNITGAVLNSPGNEEAFSLTGSFGTIGEAESFFSSYHEVVDSVFHPLTENMIVNQVWTIHTKSKKYAKILIREINFRKDIQVSDYVEIKVRYKYQPNGSRLFTAI